MYEGSQILPPEVSEPYRVDPRANERHGAAPKRAKTRGRHARHKSHRPFGWLQPHHARSHD